MKTLFLTGANRGIGLAMVQEARERGDIIFAGCRHPHEARALQTLAAAYPQQIFPIPIDVSDVQSITNAAELVARHAACVDLLINNAGVFPRGEHIGNLQADTMLHAFRVNSVGPMMVVQAFLPLLQASKQAKIINITSQLGSITLHMSNHYSYNSSKAALNMLTRILASELKASGMVAVVVHPGWVQTDMGGAAAPLKPSESAHGILDLAESLTLADTGEFLTWDGRRHPW